MSATTRYRFLFSKLSLIRILRVARNEIRFHFQQQSFVLTVIVAPLVLLGLFAFSVDYVDMQSAARVALVDPQRLLDLDAPIPGNPVGKARRLREPSPFIAALMRMSNEQQAQGLFKQGAIDAYLVVSSDESKRLSIRSFGKLPVSYLTREAIAMRLMKKRFPSMTKKMMEDALNPFAVVTSKEKSNNGGGGGGGGDFEFREPDPFVTNMGVLFAVFYLLVLPFGWRRIYRSVRECRANRTFELLLTFAEPRELITGMVLGSTLVNILHLFFWVGMSFPVYLIGAPQPLNLQIFLTLYFFAVASQFLVAAFCLLISLADASKPMGWVRILVVECVFFGSMLLVYFAAKAVNSMCVCETGTHVAMISLGTIIGIFLLPFLGPAAALYFGCLSGRIVPWQYGTALVVVALLSWWAIAFTASRLKGWLYPIPKVGA